MITLPKCPNCGCERITIGTTDIGYSKCKCCGRLTDGEDWGWVVFCYGCDRMTEPYKTPEEALEIFKREDLFNEDLENAD